MTSVLAALFPVIGIIILGKGISLAKLINDDGWVGIDRIAYYVLFPALIVAKLAEADFDQLDWRMPVALVGAQVALGGLSVVGGLALNQPRERLGVLVQSAVRWNTYIALAFAQDLAGPQGVVLVALAAAAMIPTANTLSVVALMHFKEERVPSGELWRQLIANPLILACAGGLLLNALEFQPAGIAATTLELLAQGTIALGLLATGANIRLREMTVPLRAMLGWSLLRLAGLPMVAGTLAVLFEMRDQTLLIVIIATAVPTASNGTMLARQLGADAALAANLTACQCVLATITVSLAIWLTSLV